MAAAAAVRLTSKSFGPSPRLRPRGSNRAARRVTPPTVCPAVSTATNKAPAPTSPSAPRRLTVGGDGSAGHQPIGVRRLRAGVSPRGAQLRAKRPGAQRRHHRRQLDQHVDREARYEDPCPEVVGGIEAEPENVVVLDVQHAGGQLEDDPADQHQQRQPLQQLGNRAQWWPGEQARHDGPEFGQHHRNEDQAEADVHTLGEAVDPRRPTRPIEVGQFEPSDVLRDRLTQRGAVRDVGQQPGQDDHRQPDEQHRRRTPMSATALATGFAIAASDRFQADGFARARATPAQETRQPADSSIHATASCLSKPRSPGYGFARRE